VDENDLEALAAALKSAPRLRAMLRQLMRSEGREVRSERQK
jgi:hypothetical protein